MALVPNTLEIWSVVTVWFGVKCGIEGIKCESSRSCSYICDLFFTNTIYVLESIQRIRFTGNDTLGGIQVHNLYQYDRDETAEFR